MNNDPTTINKILTGINNTLSIANKAIPLYKETKPLIKNINKTYTNIKNNKSDLSNLLKLMKLKNNIKKENTINVSPNLINKDNYNNINNPTFFI